MCSAQVYLTECHSGKLLDWSHEQSPNRRLTNTSWMRIPIVRMKKMKTMLTQTMIPLRTAVHLEKGQHFLVAESCLAKLLEKCGVWQSIPIIIKLNKRNYGSGKIAMHFWPCLWVGKPTVFEWDPMFQHFFLLMPLCSVGQLPQSAIDCSST